MRKQVVFIADSLDNAYKFQKVLSEFDVEISAGSTLQIKKLLAPEVRRDLVVFEARDSALAHVDEVVQLAREHDCPLLLIVDESSLDQVKGVLVAPSDFVMHGAVPGECSARVARLLQDADAGMYSELITVENMTINLATYQVQVGGKPVDFTYLEYALLSFLVRHPGHTFSRDALLQHVWGFDYYGGSRTVDVHVRRVRAKLGPDLAQHLETVRGVGYLWS
ncbi:MAG TPA: transcriptional regulator [Eggerthellaceae bacterium]|nr:transcriptional regulator [Eggerthellaceae bacterium]